MNTIALTGFGIFASHSKNPTEFIVSCLKKEEDIDASVVPVAYYRSYEEARMLRGDILLMTGLAAGRKAISIERCAYNTMKAKVADTDGIFCDGEKILENGKEKLETTLPVERMEEALVNAGIPVYISEDPGRYVCNNIYYRALSEGKRPSLFVHVPSEEDMPLETAEKAIRLIIGFLKELPLQS